MPQFIFIELPSFRVRDMSGHSVNLTPKQLGLAIALYHYVRGGLPTAEYTGLTASLLFAGGEPGVWTAPNTPNGLHAEENLLLTYFQSFDLPGAYPIVDAMLFRHKPCHSCMGYFQQNGKQCKPGNGVESFRAKFTPRSDRHYTPVFYLARNLEPAQRGDLWTQLGQMWAAEFGESIASTPDIPRGQMYYLFNDSPWYALNEQENMTDTEVAEAIVSQQAVATYWIGR
ncbi:uncharacterized protein BCR38DRAFT_412893 [Pseudomassariella vexata]|uniref:Uncharacterized protein n=1 Tax=Pseudomassariella vexata TaxID=1141098 RepID=A0A1Y2DJ33_9PEZI|nr:uncharacterized protein BCR38DRAFT_412893 [Pseudomassariella vexata]ORY59186.1 hypothetical protein BCR38DRAFT_412893 [Pseudomassariella vexata]